MLKAHPLIPRTHISWSSNIDLTDVLKYVQKSPKISKKVDKFTVY